LLWSNRDGFQFQLINERERERERKLVETSGVAQRIKGKA
jgi:hypothetical protein